MIDLNTLSNDHKGLIIKMADVYLRQNGVNGAGTVLAIASIMEQSIKENAQPKPVEDQAESAE